MGIKQTLYRAVAGFVLLSAIALLLTACGGGGGAGGSSGGGTTSGGGGGTTCLAFATPTAPTIYNSVTGSGTVQVQFSMSIGNGAAVTSYIVTANPGNIATTVQATTNSIYSVDVNGLTNGTAYTFTAQGVNCLGAGTLSNNRIATPATVPNAPTIGTVISGNASVSVSFTPPGDNGGAAITHYTAISSPGNIQGSGLSSPLTVTGLTNGTSYTFTVTATNIQGSSQPSAPSSSVIPATVPDAPSNPSAWATNGSATVAFSAPASNGGVAISGYTVTSSPGNFTATAASSPISVTGLTNGTPYTFTVTATNSVGTGALSVSTASVTPASGTMFYVNGTTGVDTNAGTSGALPFKTITKALAVAATGGASTVNVAPGYYSLSNGEALPLKMVNGVNLVGDTAGLGAWGYYGGGTSWSGTIVDGFGTGGNYLWPGTTIYMGTVVAFPPGVSASLTGFHLYGGWDTCVVVDGATNANIFSNNLDGNSHSSNAAFILTTSVATLTNNIMSGWAVSNSNLGALYMTGTSTTTVRRNSITNSNTGATVFVLGGGTAKTSPTVDMGTSASPGNNSITNTNGIQGVGLGVTGDTNVVKASGNTWLPYVQGADSIGAYTVGTLITGAVSLVGGNNYTLSTSAGLQF